MDNLDFFLKCPHFREKAFIARTLEVLNPYHGMMVGVFCHTSGLSGLSS